MRGGKGLLFVAVLAAGLCVCAPATAAKKKKPKPVPVQVVSASGSTTAANQKITVTATCPAGKLAVGGGFSAPTSPAGTTSGGASDDVHFIYEDRRTAPGSWSVSAVRGDEGAAGPTLSLTATAQCRSPKLKTKAAKKAGSAKKKKKKRKLVITEASATSAAVTTANTVASATAPCPTGQKLLSGGFTTSLAPDSGSFLFPWRNRRAGTTAWEVMATKAGNNIPTTITSFAYCAKKIDVSEVTGTAALAGLVTPPQYPFASAQTTPCPKSRSLVAGGFDNTQVNTNISGFLPVLAESLSVGGAWKFTAWNLAQGSGNIGAVGYCFA